VNTDGLAESALFTANNIPPLRKQRITPKRPYFSIRLHRVTAQNAVPNPKGIKNSSALNKEAVDFFVNVAAYVTD
jgi:hypothetical protein